MNSAVMKTLNKSLHLFITTQQRKYASVNNWHAVDCPIHQSYIWIWHMGVLYVDRTYSSVRLFGPGNLLLCLLTVTELCLVWMLWVAKTTKSSSLALTATSRKQYLRHRKHISYMLNNHQSFRMKYIPINARYCCDLLFACNISFLPIYLSLLNWNLGI